MPSRVPSRPRRALSLNLVAITLGLAIPFLLAWSAPARATVVWSDDFSDGDISDWVRGENGQAWTVVNGELLQPDQFYPGNSVLTFAPIAWGNYAFDWDMRPIAKRDALGPVCWAQGGPASGGFNWDCTLNENGVFAPFTMCGVLGQTYHFRVETVGGVASLFIDGQYIVSGPYDPNYSNGFVIVETNSTSAAFDNFVLTTLAPTSTESSTWGSVKALFR